VHSWLRRRAASSASGVPPTPRGPRFGFELPLLSLSAQACHEGRTGSKLGRPAPLLLTSLAEAVNQFSSEVGGELAPSRLRVGSSLSWPRSLFSLSSERDRGSGWLSTDGNLDTSRPCRSSRTTPAAASGLKGALRQLCAPLGPIRRPSPTSFACRTTTRLESQARAESDHHRPGSAADSCY
jgi:hypothetical protein